ncbi:MAG: arsenate reductase ArsC [Firmicutes bacterium]|nr:arsenate reductase ArsC [Bacillota bacterium]
MIKVLFVCVHNSARSQMAETFLNDFGKEFFIAESAGIEKGVLNPYVVKVMDEIGYDISKNKTDSAFDFYKEGRRYTFVIKVCDEINGQRCPVFPNALKDFYWNISDPSACKGDEEQILENTREIRDQIKQKVLSFIEEYKGYALKRTKDQL